MSGLKNLFTDHPNSVGESYFEHMGSAFSFSAKMLAGGLACMVHGIFPFLCVKTGSKSIAELNERMCTHRVKTENREKADAYAAQHEAA